MSGNNKLSPKRQRFADQYLIDLNASAAATRAGYSAKTAGQQGERLLKNVEVANYIASKQEKRAAKVGVTQEYVITNLLEIVERCMQRAAITDAAGEETGVWKFDAKGATGALKLVGEHLGMFNHKAPEGTNELLAGLVRDFVRGDISTRAASRRQAQQSGEVGAGRLAPALAESAPYSAN